MMVVIFAFFPPSSLARRNILLLSPPFMPPSPLLFLSPSLAYFSSGTLHYCDGEEEAPTPPLPSPLFSLSERQIVPRLAPPPPLPLPPERLPPSPPFRTQSHEAVGRVCTHTAKGLPVLWEKVSCVVYFFFARVSARRPWQRFTSTLTLMIFMYVCTLT